MARLVAQGGASGEPLPVNARQGMPVLSGTELRPWTELGLAVEAARRDAQFFGALPSGLAALKSKCEEMGLAIDRDAATLAGRANNRAPLVVGATVGASDDRLALCHGAKDGLLGHGSIWYEAQPGGGEKTLVDVLEATDVG